MSIERLSVSAVADIQISGQNEREFKICCLLLYLRQ